MQIVIALSLKGNDNEVLSCLCAKGGKKCCPEGNKGTQGWENP